MTLECIKERTQSFTCIKDFALLHLKQTQTGYALVGTDLRNSSPRDS